MMYWIGLINCGIKIFRTDEDGEVSIVVNERGEIKEVNNMVKEFNKATKNSCEYKGKNEINRKTYFYKWINKKCSSSLYKNKLIKG